MRVYCPGGHVIAIDDINDVSQLASIMPAATVEELVARLRNELRELISSGNIREWAKRYYSKDYVDTQESDELLFDYLYARLTEHATDVLECPQCRRLLVAPEATTMKSYLPEDGDALMPKLRGR